VLAAATRVSPQYWMDIRLYCQESLIRQEQIQAHTERSQWAKTKHDKANHSLEEVHVQILEWYYLERERGLLLRTSPIYLVTKKDDAYFNLLLSFLQVVYKKTDNNIPYTT
jgi:hypothetical protein